MITIITGEKGATDWTVSKANVSTDKRFIIVGELSQLIEIFGRLSKDRHFSFVEFGKDFNGSDTLITPSDFNLLSEEVLKGFTLIVLQGAELVDGLDRFKEVFLFNPPNDLNLGEQVKWKRLVEDQSKEMIEVKHRNKKGYIENLWKPVYRLV